MESLRTQLTKGVADLEQKDVSIASHSVLGLDVNHCRLDALEIQRADFRMPMPISDVSCQFSMMSFWPSVFERSYFRGRTPRMIHFLKVARQFQWYPCFSKASTMHVCGTSGIHLPLQIIRGDHPQCIRNQTYSSLLNSFKVFQRASAVAVPFDYSEIAPQRRQGEGIGVCYVCHWFKGFV